MNQFHPPPTLIYYLLRNTLIYYYGVLQYRNTRFVFLCASTAVRAVG